MQNRQLKDNPIKDSLTTLNNDVPERSAWPEIKNKLEQLAIKRHRQQVFVAWSIAASVCITAVLSWIIITKPTQPENKFNEIVQYSQSLEKKLRSLNQQHTVSSVDSTILITELEDMIALVDYQLNQGEISNRTNLNLWNQRVELMKNLIELQTNHIHKTSYSDN